MRWLLGVLGIMAIVLILGTGVYKTLGWAVAETAAQDRAAIGHVVTGERLEQARRDHAYLHGE